MELSNRYTISLLCFVAKVSRGGYYKWVKRAKSNKYSELITLITFEQSKRHGIYGYRRMKAILRMNYDIIVNHKLLRKVMKRQGLQAIIRRRKTKYIRNEVSNFMVKNILNRDFISHEPHTKFVTDITYIPTMNEMTYLSVMYDLYNGEIVSYKVSRCPDSSLSIDVVKQLSEKCHLKGTLIHSDQGIHYTNCAYHTLLKNLEVTQSMSRRGNCYDNAMAENFFSHFKSESYKTCKQAMRKFSDVKEIVTEYIHFYNHERPQDRLGSMSPVQYREYHQKCS